MVYLLIVARGKVQVPDFDHQLQEAMLVESFGHPSGTTARYQPWTRNHPKNGNCETSCDRKSKDTTNLTKYLPHSYHSSRIVRNCNVFGCHGWGSGRYVRRKTSSPLQPNRIHKYGPKKHVQLFEKCKMNNQWTNEWMFFYFWWRSSCSIAKLYFFICRLRHLENSAQKRCGMRKKNICRVTDLQEGRIVQGPILFLRRSMK